MQQIEENGVAILKEVIPFAQCDELSDELDKFLLATSSSKAGVRNLFQHSPAVCRFVRQTSIRNIIEPILSKAAFAVRAILFDKSPEANWYVTWHQDTFIAVKERHDIRGYGSWSVKDEILHVKPPAAILEKMVTLRLHLDPCDVENGPLRVIPASHQTGILPSGEIAQMVEKSQEIVCPVEKGDCVLMLPLLVHASSRAKQPARRRVLHLEFANGKLPAPLEWHECH